MSLWFWVPVWILAAGVGAVGGVLTLTLGLAYWHHIPVHWYRWGFHYDGRSRDGQWHWSGKAQIRAPR